LDSRQEFRYVDKGPVYHYTKFLRTFLHNVLFPSRQAVCLLTVEFTDINLLSI
jgi:hypothetical protein